MDSRPLLVTPSGRLRCRITENFPWQRYQGLVRPVGLQERQVGGEVNNGAVHNSRLLTSPGPAHTTRNFAPNEYRGVVNPSGLAVYKGSMQEIMIVATESKNRKKTGGLNSGGNMDRGPMTFTSDVSLPKDDKRAMRGKQIKAGQLTGLKTHCNANYATKERNRLKIMGSTPG